MNSRLTYAVVTPAHNEAAHLRQLAGSMRSQTVLPREWMIVDNGSVDDTEEAIAEIARSTPWVRSIFVPKDDEAPRGAPIVRAFHVGVDALGDRTDVVVKLDADITFGSDFFEQILNAFEADLRLGITGGLCLERDSNGVWKPTHVTRGHVRGATRAYRATCLSDVLPLDERMGWDGIDELCARVAGWETRSIETLPFRHHRTLGAREDRWQKWIGQGRMGHYMGYRPSYLAARALFRSFREPRAVGMLWGFGAAAIRGEERYRDPAVRAYLRRQQRLRELPARILEASGHSSSAR
jgi:glycosyltransferase involved in cell wall biosynthesis